MLDQMFDMTSLESKHVRSGYSVLAELFFYSFICKMFKINANGKFCMISWFGDEA